MCQPICLTAALGGAENFLLEKTRSLDSRLEALEALEGPLKDKKKALKKKSVSAKSEPGEDPYFLKPKENQMEFLGRPNGVSRL